MKGLYTILFCIAAVAVGAVSDGLNDDGAKYIGHLLGALEVGLLISGAFILDLKRRDWLAFFLTYVFWRMVGFDLIYNVTRSLPILYTGASSYWDAFLSKQLPQGIVFARVIIAGLAVGIPLKHIND